MSMFDCRFQRNNTSRLLYNLNKPVKGILRTNLAIPTRCNPLRSRRVQLRQGGVVAATEVIYDSVFIGELSGSSRGNGYCIEVAVVDGGKRSAAPI